MMAIPDTYIRDSYLKLLISLFETPFTWSVLHDENRAEDGLKLREIYINELEECGDEPHGIYEAGPDCTLLEMFLALAIRCGSELMYDPSVGEQVDRWFFMMMDNQKLNYLDNNHWDEERFNYICEHFCERKYGPNGEFCAFFVPENGQIMDKNSQILDKNSHKIDKNSQKWRKMELAYQMNYYIKWRFPEIFE